MLRAAVLVLIACSAASAASAAPADPVAAVLNQAVRPGPAPSVRLSLAKPDAEAYALRSAGIARTAVERRSDDATAALGFLCGIQEGAGRTGAAAARGSDPMGRFLGAKFSLAFR